ASEFVVGFLTPAVSVAALAAVAFGLLRDHVGAWVLFGAISYGGRAAAALLEQPAETHKLSGLLGLALVLLAAVAVVAGRRGAGGRRAGVDMPAPAPPAPPNVEGSA